MDRSEAEGIRVERFLEAVGPVTKVVEDWLLPESADRWLLVLYEPHPPEPAPLVLASSRGLGGKPLEKPLVERLLAAAFAEQELTPAEPLPVLPWWHRLWNWVRPRPAMWKQLEEARQATSQAVYQTIAQELNSRTAAVHLQWLLILLPPGQTACPTRNWQLLGDASTRPAKRAIQRLQECLLAHLSE